MLETPSIASRRCQIGQIGIDCDLRRSVLFNTAKNSARRVRSTLNAAIIKMQGLSLAGMKKHPALLPLFFCIGLGGAGAFFYTLRLATRNPDVSWLSKKDAEPWNNYKDKQYKFYATKSEISNAKSPAPEY